MVCKLQFAAMTFVIATLLGCGSKDSGDSTESTSAGSTAPSSSGGWGAVLRFSAIPDQDKTELKEKFDALAKHLTEKLEVEVEYVPSSDYKASVDAFKTGDIHLAWFGGLTGVQARHAVPGARAIAQGKSDPKFRSYIIAHKDTGLEKSEEFPKSLGEFTFTFGSESSTSGRLMPEFFLRQNVGKGPEEFFKKPPSFSGSHDKTVELVESGQVQTGAVNYKVYDTRVAEGTTDPQVCKIIWVTPDYADYNFTAHPEIDEVFGQGFTGKLQAALIGITDAELLSAFPREALIEANNEDFEGIEKVAKELGFLR